MWSPIVKWFLIILILRGALGIYQDCNYWWHKDFNATNIKNWLQGFRR